MTSRYNLKNIRTLLTEGFTDEELRQLCYDVPDFRPVYDQLRPDCSKVQIVNLLIEHSDRKLQIETLLNLAKQYNPLRYEQHGPYYDKTEATTSDKAQRKQKGSETIVSATPRDSTSWWRKPEWVAPIIVALITVIGSATVAFINIQQAETKVRQELQPTISALEIEVAKLTATPSTQLITVTEIVQVTPTPDKNILSLENLPFIALVWSTAEIQSETGWASLSIINDTKSQKMYYFSYTLPMTSTKYSGAGLTFKFNDSSNLTDYVPQDLTEYSYVSVNITFGAPDTRCDLILLDISNKSNSVALSPNIALNQDIERRRSGLTETFTIPLDTYFGNVSRKDIKEIACATDTNISPGSHKMTINGIVFSK